MSEMSYCVNIELALPKSLARSIANLRLSIQENLGCHDNVTKSASIPPHITLHYLFLTCSRLMEAMELVRGIVERTEAPEIVLGQVKATRSRLLFIRVAGKHDLSGLHSELVGAL